jgi:cobalt transport protein
MASNTTIYIVGFAIIAIMVIGTLAYGLSAGDEFGGSDDSGGSVAEDDYGYEPWTGNWMEDLGFELPGETESLLFAVQAAIGAIIIGYFIGLNAGRKDKEAEQSKA